MKLRKWYIASLLAVVCWAKGTLSSSLCDNREPEFKPRPSSPAEALLSQALTNEYTTFSNPLFPKHSFRIRKTPSDWCDPSVNSYTGYIDTTPARHLFFFFFESRRSPESDDVILWLNGGPGASSSMGLFQELGPCYIDDETGPKRNLYSWNENANIIFIDQPVGVGYSYAEYGEQVSTTEEAAVDIAAFFAIFFNSFKKFSGRRFHMAGESYAGKYIPVFASTIYDQNKVLKANGLTEVNLQSLLIGNGDTNTAEMLLSYYDIQCTTASMTPIQSISNCVRMKTAVPRCRKWLEESCVNAFDLISCSAAMGFCYSELEAPYMAAGLNPQDMSMECQEMYSFNCYPEGKFVDKYLDSPSTRKILGVSNSLSNTTYQGVNMVLNSRFGVGLDVFKSITQYYLENLLDRGVKVLIYVGTYDFVCNWVGNLRMVDSLEWSAAEEFRKDELRDWKMNTSAQLESAGKVKSGGGLSFWTIEGAGHMVPHDKPKQALYMLNKWIDSV